MTDKKDNLIIRHICRMMDLIEFKDFRGRKVFLSEESWNHIQWGHPEISIEDLEQTLRVPDEVRQSRYQQNVELYYALKELESRIRFKCVVVKVLKQGCFVSSAMTTSTIKNGLILYKKS